MRLTRQQAAALGIDTGTAPARRHKYNARRTVCDGIAFASAKESRRHGELRLLLQAGAIADLELQPVYELHEPGGKVVGRYVADFRYRDVATGAVVIEDVKGYRTRQYRTKKRHVEAEYGIVIVEVMG